MSKFTDLLSNDNTPITDQIDPVKYLEALESELGIDNGTTMYEEFDDIDSATGSEPTDDSDDDEDPSEEGCKKEGCGQAKEGCGSAEEGCGVTEEDDDDIDDLGLSDISDDDDLDPDELSDDELKALDAELSGMSDDDDDDDDDDDKKSLLGDDDKEEELTPEEEIQADDMMSVAATTLLVNDELSGDEKKEFCESETETSIAVREGFMTEADINEIAYECGLITEAKYTNKMIIRLDVASKKKQLYALAVNVSAAAHNDPDYRKLKKVMKMRKILRAKLDRNTHGEAMKSMKVYYARLRKSKSSTLQKVAARSSKK